MAAVVIAVGDPARGEGVPRVVLEVAVTTLAEDVTVAVGTRVVTRFASRGTDDMVVFAPAAAVVDAMVPTVPAVRAVGGGMAVASAAAAAEAAL